MSVTAGLMPVVAAVSAELRAILQNKICKILQFLCHVANSAHVGLFCPSWPILHKILRVQNRRILTLLFVSNTTVG